MTPNQLNRPDPQIELRPAEADDADHITAIWHSGWRDGHVGFVPDEVMKERDKTSFGSRARRRLGDTTVAAIEGTVAGFVMVVEDEVEQIYVSAAFRGSGVADALLSDAERQVAAIGYGEAWLAVVDGNARARSFYQRKGWGDAGPKVYAAATSKPGKTVDVPVRIYRKQLINRSDG